MTDWWYVRAYPGHPDLMDEASRTLLPWLRDLAIRENAPKWFFARYWDMAGHHLRLRIQCSADGADRIHAQADELTTLIASLGNPAEPDRIVPGSVPQGLPAAKRIRTCLYAPELAKYGGARGVAIAEELFTASTAWYVDNNLAELSPLFDRAALAAHYMSSLVRTALPGEQQKQFWTAHRHQWGRQLRMAVPIQDDLRNLLSRTAGGVRDASSAGIHLRRGLDEHVTAVARTLDQAEEDGNPVPRPELLLQYLHMDLNRWGFVPAEECLLGIVATTRSFQ